SRLALVLGAGIALGAGVVAVALSYPRPGATSSPPTTEGGAEPAKPSSMIALRARPELPVRHKGGVKAVCLAGGHLVSAGADGNIVISRPDGSESRVLHYDVPLNAVALTPDG